VLCNAACCFHSTQCWAAVAAAWPCTLPAGYCQLLLHIIVPTKMLCADVSVCLCCLPLLQGELDELEDEAAASSGSTHDLSWITTREYLAMGSLFATGASSLTQLLLQAGGAFLKHVANGDYKEWHDVGGLVCPVCQCARCRCC
jgi:hypothetical protein